MLNFIILAHVKQDKKSIGILETNNHRIIHAGEKKNGVDKDKRKYVLRY